MSQLATQPGGHCSGGQDIHVSCHIPFPDYTPYHPSRPCPLCSLTAFLFNLLPPGSPWSFTFISTGWDACPGSVAHPSPPSQHSTASCTLHHRHYFPTLYKLSNLEDSEGSAWALLFGLEFILRASAEPGKHPRHLDSRV